MNKIQYVTIFGGSQTAEGENGYESAKRLGAQLALAGITVVTGGYMGTMEAASRGAAEVGGHVIGVTCAEIETWRPIRHNSWVKEEHRCATLMERLSTLIELGDAAIALPGGPGTLAEVSLTWNLLIIGVIPVRPLILVGPEWKNTFQVFIQNFNRYIPHAQQKLIQFAKDGDNAVQILLDLS